MGKLNLRSLLGMTIYSVDQWRQSHEISEYKIIAVGLDGEGEIEIFACSSSKNIIGNDYLRWEKVSSLRNNYHFSKRKAENVQNSLLLADEASARRREKRKTILEYNKDLVTNNYSDLVGKEILIKSFNGKWIKSRIINVYPGDIKKGTVYISESASHNSFRLDRENKNWKFHTKAEETRLIIEAKKLELAELEELYEEELNSTEQNN